MATSMNALDGMQTLPIVKQVALLVGLAASIALAVYVGIWAQGVDYMPLGGQWSDKETSEVVEALNRGGIAHTLDPKTGLVLVESTQLQAAKLQLAKEGVSKQGGYGLELLDQKTGLTTSQFVERTRYVRGLQGELERTISQIHQIKKARVHLAIPKQNSFIRHKKPPSASVFIDIIGGVKLNPNQVAAIINLVATSIQGLSPDMVTVIDQYGALLSNQTGGELALATEQLDYKHKLENMYAKRVQDLLSPLVGVGRISAEVTADIDYLGTEKTFETYDPDNKSIRSEQTLDVERGALEMLGGIPGALSNVPPANPGVPETNQALPDGAEGGQSNNKNVRKQATRNFEINRTIGHERKLPGNLIKMSVAVVIDDKVTYNNVGKQTKTPYDEQSILQMTNLVKNAIGFNEARGDSVSVINSSFAQAEPIEDLPEMTIFEKPWFMSVVKQGLAGLFVLIVLFVIIRPFMRNLSQVSQLQNDHNKKILELTKLNESAAKQSHNSDEMTRMRSLIHDDPKRVAQVVKTMVTTEND